MNWRGFKAILIAWILMFHGMGCSDGVKIPPSLVVEEGASRNLGEVRGGQPRNEVFTIRNDTGKTIDFDPKIDSSCSCTSAALDARRLKPGESTKLRLSITPTKIHKQKQAADVLVRQVAASEKPLHIRVDWVSTLPASFRPSVVRFFGMPKERIAVPLQMEPNGDARVAVRKIEVECPAPFQVSFASKSGSEPAANVTFTSTLPEVPGKYRGLARIFVDGSEQATFLIPLECVVAPPIRVLPPNLVIEPKVKGSAGPIRFRVEAVSPFQIIEISAAAKYLTFHWDRQSRDVSQDVAVLLETKLCPTASEETVIHLVGHSEDRELRVEVPVFLNRGDL